MKLSGLKVLDLSAFLPGPHMTMMMADHGADVIMIEPANGVGEPTREIGQKTDDGVSVWFRNIARGKRSLYEFLNLLVNRRTHRISVRTSSCCYSFSLLFLPSMTYQLTSKRRFGINFRRACSIFCRFIAVKFRQYSQRLTTKRGFASGSLNFDVASKVQAIVSRMRTRFLCALATNLATIHSQLLAHCSSNLRYFQKKNAQTFWS